jgi:hypothetical protein
MCAIRHDGGAGCDGSVAHVANRPDPDHSCFGLMTRRVFLMLTPP